MHTRKRLRPCPALVWHRVAPGHPPRAGAADLPGPVDPQVSAGLIDADTAGRPIIAGTATPLPFGGLTAREGEPKEHKVVWSSRLAPYQKARKPAVRQPPDGGQQRPVGAVLACYGVPGGVTGASMVTVPACRKVRVSGTTGWLS